MATTVRPATLEDVPTILEIGKTGWNATYGDLLEQETIDSAIEEWYGVEPTRAYVEHEDVGYFVAERDGDIVGYVSGGPADEGDDAMLGAIYVDPEYWGDGVGTAMLERFETFCSEKGYEAIRLEVLSKNDIAISFYEARGFDFIEEAETDLFGETVRESIFRKELS